jgi:hypothetical protein
LLKRQTKILDAIAKYTFGIDETNKKQLKVEADKSMSDFLSADMKENKGGESGEGKFMGPLEKYFNSKKDTTGGAIKDFKENFKGTMKGIGADMKFVATSAIGMLPVVLGVAAVLYTLYGGFKAFSRSEEEHNKAVQEFNNKNFLEKIWFSLTHPGETIGMAFRECIGIFKDLNTNAEQQKALTNEYDPEQIRLLNQLNKNDNDVNRAERIELSQQLIAGQQKDANHEAEDYIQDIIKKENLTTITQVKEHFQDETKRNQILEKMGFDLNDKSSWAKHYATLSDSKKKTLALTLNLNESAFTTGELELDNKQASSINLLNTIIEENNKDGRRWAYY